MKKKEYIKDKQNNIIYPVTHEDAVIDSNGIKLKDKIDAELDTKQDTLVSGENIKTINNVSILGEGNIYIQGGGEDPNAVKFVEQTLTSEQQTQARTNIGAGTYTKDVNGIPAADLASTVQASLGKADNALQSVKTFAGQSLSGSGDVVVDVEGMSSGYSIKFNLGYGANFVALLSLSAYSLKGIYLIKVSGTSSQITKIAGVDSLGDAGVSYNGTSYFLVINRVPSGTASQGSAQVTFLQGTAVPVQGTATESISSSLTIQKFYVKPSAGIPKSDLASAVQASLDNADSAIHGVDFTISNSTRTIKFTQISSSTRFVALLSIVSSSMRGVYLISNLAEAEKIYGDDILDETKFVYDGSQFSVIANVVQDVQLATARVIFVAGSTVPVTCVATQSITSGNPIHTLYEKPSSGIPATDIASGVIPEISTDISSDATSDTKTASPKAVKDYVDAHGGSGNAVTYTAQTLTSEQQVQARTNIGAGTYTKAGTGIPSTDLAEEVQETLELAESAVQAEPVGSVTPLVDPYDYATKEEVNQLAQKLKFVDTPAVQSGYIKTNATTINGTRSSSSSVKSAFFPVKQGDIVTIYGEGENSNTYRLYAFADPEYAYVSRYSSYGDYRTNPLVVTVPSGVAYMAINFAHYAASTDFATKASDVDFYAMRAAIEKNAEDIAEPISTSKLEDEAVIPAKTDFIKLLNIFDKDAAGVELGKYIYNNSLSVNSSYNTTDYIPVTAGKTYLVASMSISYGVRFVCYYNANKTYISSADNDWGRTLTIPSGVSYMRCSFWAEAWETYRVTDDVTATKYYPYGYYLVPSYIYDSSKIVPEICLPSKIFALNGEENSIYHRNYINFADKRFFVNGNWPYLARCFRTNTPAAQFAVNLNNIADLSTEKSFAADVLIGNKATNNGAKVVNAIGDSFTYNGTWYNFANSLCPALSWVGMRKSTMAESSLRAEGRGGWSLEDYMTRKGSATTSFSPFLHPSGYTYYGCIESWAAIVAGSTAYNLAGFTDFVSWFGADGKKLNPSVNDMMYDETNNKYIYWTGSSWVEYSGTPSFVFDYGKYIAAWGITSPDIVMIMLGVNDWFAGFNEAKAATWNSYMQTVIGSIQAYATAVGKTIKIAICTNTVHIGTENNSYYKPDEQIGRQMWLGRKNLIETFDTAEYLAEGVYVVDTGVCLDPDYGYSEEGIKPFDFYSGSDAEIYTDNGVHPSTAGYKQIGVCAAAFIQYVR